MKALACELPSRLGVPLSRLHVPDIRAEAIARGIVAELSGATIWRWLHEDAIRPRSHRSWIFPRDPEFEAKAGRVLDLYAGLWEGKPEGCIYSDHAADLGFVPSARHGQALLANDLTDSTSRLRRGSLSKT